MLNNYHSMITYSSGELFQQCRPTGTIATLLPASLSITDHFVTDSEYVRKFWITDKDT